LRSQLGGGLQSLCYPKVDNITSSSNKNYSPRVVPFKANHVHILLIVVVVVVECLCSDNFANTSLNAGGSSSA
jgi:hypothetical protein